MTFLSIFYTETHNVSEQQCVVCCYHFKNWRALTSHIKNKHMDVWLQFTKSAEEEKKRQQNSNSGFVVCPICNHKGRLLTHHMKYQHSLSTEQCKITFPEYRWASYISHDDVPCCCVFSKREFASVRGMSSSQSAHFKELYDMYCTVSTQLKVRNNPAPIICVLCSKPVQNIKTHNVLSHAQLSWDEFRKLQNLPADYKRVTTNRHRHKLSENKTHFYNETPTGIQAKLAQSAKFKTNNPSKRANVRELNSKKHAGACNWATYTQGCMVKWHEFKFKSLNEALFYKLCIDRNIPVQYESFVIRYTDAHGIKRAYTPDFVLDGTTIVEIKCINFKRKQINIEKYEAISKLIPIEILTPPDMCSYFGITRKTLLATYHSIGQLVDQGTIQVSQILPFGRHSRVHKLLKCQPHNIKTRIRRNKNHEFC
jgi:predicted transcriptional regulator